MAIDDNKTYGLKGSQVKDLAGKVKDAAKTFYELTEDDYNWNTTTQDATEPYDCVALWLLPAGLYRRKSNIETHTSKTQRYNNDFYIFVMPEKDENAGDTSMILVPESPSPLYEAMYLVTEKATGNGLSGYTSVQGASFLRHNNIAGSLYDNDSTKVVSATAGYNLRREIDSQIKAKTNTVPSSSTEGIIGQLAVDSTGHVWVCVAVPTSQDPDYHWTQIV